MASKLGRPCKLDERTRDILIEALANGCYRETAARLAGIHISTLYRWLETGEADHENNKTSLFRDLYEGANRAEAAAEAHALAVIRNAMPLDWRAAAHFLERRYPAQWGRKDAVKVEHSGRVAHDVRQMSDDELRELAGGLEQRRASTS